jgi:hypothetical protein
MDVGLWNAVHAFVKADQFDLASDYLEKRLLSQSKDRFCSLVHGRFSNLPSELLDHLNGFIEACRTEFQLRAVYLEMNEFDANFDCWYFDSFAYRKRPVNSEGMDWLSDWDTSSEEQLTLTGLEVAQKDFRWYSEKQIHKRNIEYRRAKELAMLLVLVRFIQLIKSAIQSGKLARSIPIFVSSHEFDIVWIHRPRRSKSR